MNADIKRRKREREKKGRWGEKEEVMRPPEVAGAAAADAADWERNRNATECGPPVLYIDTSMDTP